MDILTFTAEVIKAVVWPASLLVLAFLLRKPLKELIPLLRRLRYKEVEIEFSREIAMLKVKSLTEQPSDLPSAGVTSPGLPERLESKRLELLRMVPFSARVAVMEAWLEVEGAANEVASSFWSQPPSEIFRSDSTIGEYLFKCNVIGRHDLETFKRLRHLRNSAAHAEEINLSDGDAISYVEVALSLAAKIRSH
ncbi:hypothetical protein Q7W57_20770 [Stenotrophomonas geniculata]|uniref:DUF4145 domain-containing protein n=1 Tax=Stenotrophomonas geniculata TaxID=86188 RepID=A0AAP5F4M3_9GAMM|nr:hypothetical protein [Stenotrophomonas geniculata]MDP4310844.1 hypothetical protein [Stenotrophomonas geniculata]MDQ7954224.1 hypothetical protein [Stenotrophomonas geniculata]